jgi:hypothetical protein
MVGGGNRSEGIGTRALRVRVDQLECRECGVICERVVSPSLCLESRNTCVYAFVEGGTMYFGCLHKVFLPELDVAPFSAAGDGHRPRADPYGPLRVFRSPLPQCPVTIERAYAESCARTKCMNPDFGLWSRRSDPDSCGAPDPKSGEPI